MVNKKILIVCRAFYPDISPRSFRATELAKEFARQGHDVTVRFPTRDYDYSSFEIKNNLKIKNLGQLNWKGVELKGSKVELLLRRALKRGLQVLLEYPGIELMFKVSDMLKQEKRYDLLISVATPHTIHWGVARVWDKKKEIAKTWIADCGDPFMFARLDTFKKPFYLKYFEKDFCKKCDFISVPFTAMHEQFYPEFKRKIITIPQGFDFREIIKYEGLVKNDRQTFIYAGSIIPGLRDLSLLLDFLKDYKKDFLFIVYTNKPKWFDNYKEQLSSKLVVKEFIERIPLIFEMSKADFLVNVDTRLDSESNAEAMPSKLIDYALSGRPILSINSGRLDTNKVQAFLAGDYSGARIIDINRYDIRVVSNQFLEAKA